MMIKEFFARLVRFGENPEAKFNRENQAEREAAQARREQIMANMKEEERLKRLAEDVRAQTQTKDKAA